MKNVLMAGFVGALLAVGMTAAPEAKAFPRACNASNVGSYTYTYVSSTVRNVDVCTTYDGVSYAWRYYDQQLYINGVWVWRKDVE